MLFTFVYEGLNRFKIVISIELPIIIVISVRNSELIFIINFITFVFIGALVARSYSYSIYFVGTSSSFNAKMKCMGKLIYPILSLLAQ